MKKKIDILGSTGSIGKSLLEIINKDKKKFRIILLTANQNYKLLIKQATRFRVKNLIITDNQAFEKTKKKYKSKFNIFNNFDDLKKIFHNKIDYTMSSITGIQGLKPTLNIIKFSKKIAIANKESIVCGWNLIKNELKKNNTEFIPVDSEHFSLWFGLKGLQTDTIEKIYLTASGGPLYKKPLIKIKNIKQSEVLKHPTWKMGKKISIDSATMINKIYEVIEAKNIFNIPYKKIKILIHPKSYIHAILKFQNGLIKIIAHDTTMQIPIFNTLYNDENKKISTKNLNINVLNDLKFNNVSSKKYPYIDILKLLTKNNSLFETVIVSINDELVNLFLQNKIKFKDIHQLFYKLINTNKFSKYKRIVPQKISDIVELNNYVRLLINKNVIKKRNEKK